MSDPRTGEEFKITVVLAKGENRLYQPIADLTILMQLLTAYNMRLANIPPQSSGGQMHIAHRSKHLLLLPLVGPAEIALAGKEPSPLAVGIAIRPDHMPSTSGAHVHAPINRLYSNIVGPIFLTFYEGHRPWWVGRFNRDEKTWPPVLRFARVVRNAVAHHGRLDWASPHVGAVTWSGLTYTHADNGRAIFGSGDLAVADMVFLMMDMSAELDRLGCPVAP
jgi:hypothetical protein